MGSRTDAIREKEIAETLMRNQDFNGARERLLRARTLYPQLENINPMITVCNILFAAHSQPHLAINWYMVLETHPEAEHSHIVSQYQMLTKSLQAIKNNKFPCTDSALILLHNAFSVLSDKKKRLAYDLRRFTDLNNLPDKTGGNVGELVGSYDFGNKKSDAMYYDFGSIRRRVVFEVGQIWAAYDDEAMPRRYAKINWIIRGELLPFQLGVTWLEPIPANKHEKMWLDVGLPVVCGGFSLKGSKMVVNESTDFSHVVSRIQGLQVDKVDICPKKGEVWVVFENWKPFEWCQDPKTREGSGHMLVEILTSYTKHEGVTVACLIKVAGLSSTFQRCMHTGVGSSSFTIPANHLLKFSHNVPAYRFKGGEISGASDGMFELDPLSMPRDIVVDIVSSSKEKSSSDCSSFTDQASISSFVDLDPEIIEAKCKWSRNDFTKNQVWAVYDGPHSMPQRYVVVNNAISDTEVCTVFLEPHPKLEDEIYWVGENLPFVCGLFEVGRTTIMRMSQFSHVVTCEMNIEKSLYRIYPKKGDIWAMYKNWHPKWKNCDYQSHQCQIVEVLSDFSEGADMKIASLLEVDDYATFFRRKQCNGFEFIRVIPRSKMLNFSHQIPCFVVARIEDHEFPKGSLHIEPDALPRQQKNLMGAAAQLEGKKSR